MRRSAACLLPILLAAHTGCGKSKSSTSTAPASQPNPSGGNEGNGGNEGGGGNDAGTIPDDQSPAQTGILNIDTQSPVTFSDEDLKLGSSVSLVTPKSATDLPLSTPGAIDIQTALRLVEGDDYANMETYTYVADPSMDALDYARAVLCVVAQTGYTKMVGKGDYVALADDKRCFERGSGGPSATTAKKFARMVVNATREKDRPIELKIWMARESENLSMKIKIAKGATQANPFGVFRMNYTTSGRKGTAEAYEKNDGQVFLSVYDAEGSADKKAAAIFHYDATAKKVTSGLARAQIGAAGPVQGSDYSVAFDDAYYLAKNSADSKSRCLSRNDYSLNAYDYALFAKGTGKRRTTEKTFRTLTRTVSGKDDYGVADLYGIDFADLTPVKDGDTIKVFDPLDAAAAPTPHTASVIPGSLKVMARETLDLAFVKKARFIVDQELIRYDATGNHFQVVAEKQFHQQSGQAYWADVSPRTFTSTPGDLATAFENDQYTAVYLTLDNTGALTAAARAVDRRVAPATNQVFWCFSSCPKGGFSQADFAAHYQGNTANTLYANATNVSGMVRYTYDAATGLLYDTDNGNLAVTADFDIGMNDVAISTGMMVTDAYHQAHMANTTYFNSIPDSESRYVWTSGPGTGLKRIALLDADDAPIVFDPPTDLFYIHTQANDRTGRDGSRYYDTAFPLSITTWGALAGLLYTYDSDAVFAPGFSMKDGTDLGSDVKVKASVTEERLPSTDAAKCAALALANLPELPKATVYQDPSLGAAPSPTGSPAFIGGAPAP